MGELRFMLGGGGGWGRWPDKRIIHKIDKVPKVAMVLKLVLFKVLSWFPSSNNTTATVFACNNAEEI